MLRSAPVESVFVPDLLTGQGAFVTGGSSGIGAAGAHVTGASLPVDGGTPLCGPGPLLDRMEG